MDRLYYLTNEQFGQINRLLPPEQGRRGRPPTVKNREVLEGILHVLRTGTPWRDLPNAYGPWHTIYMRWQRWIARGVWGDILGLLKRLKGVDLSLVFLDSTVVRAHQHAAGAAKKRRSGPRSLAGRIQHPNSCRVCLRSRWDRDPPHGGAGGRRPGRRGAGRCPRSLRRHPARRHGQSLRQQRHPRPARRQGHHPGHPAQGEPLGSYRLR
ncbi:MAG: IS5 family transposase [Candidatus Competibacteraceae bacterium]|nr:MAG: IS5 family transposase [Candidatus Competibacteraceae bacterium]